MNNCFEIVLLTQKKAVSCLVYAWRGGFQLVTTEIVSFKHLQRLLPRFYLLFSGFLTGRRLCVIKLHSKGQWHRVVCLALLPPIKLDPCQSMPAEDRTTRESLFSSSTMGMLKLELRCQTCKVSLLTE